MAPHLYLSLFLHAVLPPCSAIRVIGAGIGRTGTDSLREALETLGFGPTYHMKEVLGFGLHNYAYRAGHIHLWGRATKGAPDFSRIFFNYTSAVDAPSYNWYPELREAYPDAKVVLTVRSSGKVWWNSIRHAFCEFSHDATLLGWLRSTRFFRTLYPWQQKFMDLHHAMNRATARTFRNFSVLAKNKIKGLENFSLARVCTDEAFAIGYYESWNAMVKEMTPPDKLLVFEVGRAGWKELAGFLGVDVPKHSAKFVHANTQAEFKFVIGIHWVEVALVYALPFLALVLLSRLMLGKKSKKKEE